MNADKPIAKRTGVIAGFVVVVFVIGIGIIAGRDGRHKHHTKLIRTKSHKVYVENKDGSCYAFVASAGGDGADIILPTEGSSSFRLPAGNWARANPPSEDEIEEEEEATIEESDAGEPEADATGDVGADSDGSAPADSGGGGSDDGGGGDGGGDGA